jgi:hypothetical protein
MIVQQLDTANFAEWDDFILLSPQYSIFAHTWYVAALGVKFDIFVVRADDAIVGGILLPKDKWKYYINPIFSKYLGVFFGDFVGNAYTVESRKRKVLKALMPMLNSLSSFEYTFHPNFGNWMQFHKAGFKQTTLYTYKLALAQKDGAALLKDFYPRLRNKVLNAQQSDFVVNPLELSTEVIDLLQQTYTTKGNTFPIALPQLNNLLRVLLDRNALQLTGVFKENRLLAVLGLVHDGQTAYLIFNGLKADVADKGANELLVFEGLKWATEQGLQCFDFEGSMVPNIESFYRQFGGILTPYHKIWMESNQRSLRNLKQKLL